MTACGLSLPDAHLRKISKKLQVDFKTLQDCIGYLVRVRGTKDVPGNFIPSVSSQRMG
jgi:hypothetical protein